MEIQIIAATKKNIPVCLLVRDPVDAVRSLLVYDQNIPIEFAFKRYIDFYTRIYPVIGRCYVAFFQDVIKDFGSVINKINLKFDTQFESMTHNVTNIDKVMKMIDDINIHIHGDDKTKNARPDKLRENKTSVIEIDKNADYVLEAIKIYNKYIYFKLTTAKEQMTTT